MILRAMKRPVQSLFRAFAFRKETQSWNTIPTPTAIPAHLGIAKLRFSKPSRESRKAQRLPFSRWSLVRTLSTLGTIALFTRSTSGGMSLSSPRVSGTLSALSLPPPEGTSLVPSRDAINPPLSMDVRERGIETCIDSIEHVTICSIESIETQSQKQGNTQS